MNSIHGLYLVVSPFKWPVGREARGHSRFASLREVNAHDTTPIMPELVLRWVTFRRGGEKI